MIRMTYHVDIHAPVNQVYDTMLGLSDKSTYNAWALEFHPSSHFRGSWEPGATIRFIGVDDQGEESGMIMRVADNRPGEYVSLKAIGVVSAGQDLYSGEGADEWIGSQENYTYREQNGITSVTVEIDYPENFEEYFNEAYPKALNRLKQYAENSI